ncbi:AsmA family protein [Aureimonas ureilytica]|uniref:AsmA family protein n=1 Tax=Aureimonas ureilytica TaxID=401562 RepID=UPI003CEB30C0
MTESPPPARRATESQSHGDKRRRGLLPIALGLLAFLVGLLFFALSQVSLQLGDAREELEARLAHLAGRPVHVDGSVSFELLPRPTAILTDLRARTGTGDDAQLLTVDRVEADFALLPALLGRAEIRRVALVRPELGPATGIDPGAAPGRAPPAEARPAPPAPVPDGAALGKASGDLRLFLVRFEGLRELDIREGLARLPGRSDSVSNINASFDWAGRGSAARLTGSAVWNGQPVRLDARLDRPLAFTEGENGPLRLSLSAPALEIGFEGNGSAGEVLQLAGALSLSTPSLSRAIDWIGRENAGVPDFGALAIQTQIHLVDDRVSFGSAALDLGEDKARGALEMVLPRPASNVPTLSGTLAFEALDLSRFSRAIAPAPKTALDFQRPIHTDFLRKIDLDLRLSAKEADLGRTTARDVAATIKSTGGVGTIDIGDMTVLGGRGDLRVTVDTSAPRADLIVAAGLRDIDMKSLKTLTGTAMPVVSGRGELQLTLRGPATNWGEIALASRTEAKLRVRDGQLAGVERGMLKTPGLRPIDSAASVPEPFRRTDLALVGVGPRLRVDKLSIVFDEGEATADGQIDLRNGYLTMRGQFDPTKIEASGVSNSFTISKPIGFKLDGEWPKPTLTVSASDGPT